MEKLKSGYQQRANIIINELNNALGMEYKLNGDNIQRYSELKENIDQLIVSKKAEAVLNAYQNEYGEALKKESEATKTLIDLKMQLKEASEKMSSSNKFESITAKQQYSEIAQKIKEQTALIGEYGKTINDYENLQKASVEGNAEAISKATENITTSYEKVKQKSQESIETQINVQAEYVNYIKETQQEALEIGDLYQEKILSNQLETERKKLNNLTESLVRQTAMVETLTPEQIQAWKNIAEQSYNEYNIGLSKVSQETRNEIEKATGIVNSDITLSTASQNKGGEITTAFGEKLKISDKAQEEINLAQAQIKGDVSVETASRNLAERASNTLKENMKGKEAGENLLEGAHTGILNKNKRNGIFNSIISLGKDIISKFKNSLDEHSPSKATREMGVYLLEGLELGILDEQSSVLNQVSEFSKKIINTFSLQDISTNIPKELNFSINSSLMPMKLKNNIKAQNTINYTNQIDNMICIVENYLSQLLKASRKNIVLSTGELIGATKDMYDIALAENQIRRERGN